MTPQEFDSFAYGFDLSSVNYSGGAGGTFTNLVVGGEDWIVNGGTPSFTTRNGMEGVDLPGTAAGVIKGQQRAMFEGTLVIAARLPGSGTYIAYGGGGTYTTFASFINGWRAQAFLALNPSGYTLAASPTSEAHVFVVTFSPANGTTYAQVDDGAIVQATKPSGEFYKSCINHFDGVIGSHAEAYNTAWIGRVLVFDRALHYRDNDNLQLLIADEMALVGL